MLRSKSVVLLNILLLTVSFSDHTEALQCYVCRGCDEPLEEHIQTCESIPQTTPTTEAPVVGTTIPELVTVESTISTETEATEITVPTEATAPTEVTAATEVTPPTEATVTTDATVTAEASVPTEVTDLTEATSQTEAAPTEATALTEATVPDTPNVPPNVQMASNNDYASRAFVRHARQVRNEEGDARCLLAVYNDENGESTVVRGCSFYSSSPEARCREAAAEDWVSDDATPEVTTCRVCNSDLCNSATKSAVALMMVLFGVIINI